MPAGIASEVLILVLVDVVDSSMLVGIASEVVVLVVLVVAVGLYVGPLVVDVELPAWVAEMVASPSGWSASTASAISVASTPRLGTSRIWPI